MACTQRCIIFFAIRSPFAKYSFILALQTAVLDGSARCCNSGERDACGVCDGTAKAVDVQNVCCQSGVLDAGGYCCESGQLDECGVCDGDSQSCLLISEVEVQVVWPVTNSSLNPMSLSMLDFHPPDDLPYQCSWV